MEQKKSIFFFILIFLAAIGIRLWHLDSQHFIYPIDFSFTLIPNDFFKILFENSIAPIYPYYMRFFSSFLENALPYTSIFLEAISVILIILCAYELKAKKNRDLIALIATGLFAASSFSIFFARQIIEMPLVFLLSSAVLLFSLKIINGKKNPAWLIISSILLILTYNLSIFFVLFNAIAVFIFSQKKKRSPFVIFLVCLGVLILFLPFCPFIFNIIKVPEYLAKYSLQLNFEQIAIFFTNIFSPQINPDGAYKIQTFGSLLFVIVPTLICVSLFIKDFITFKISSNYLTTVIVCTFLSMIILCAFASEPFMSQYLMMIYPMLIVSVAQGVFCIKSKATRILLVTVLFTTTIFYVVVENFVKIKLF